MEELRKGNHSELYEFSKSINYKWNKITFEKKIDLQSDFGITFIHLKLKHACEVGKMGKIPLPCINLPKETSLTIDFP